MILIIDNYDSFTYNLYQYLGELGWEPIVYRNDETTLEQIESLNPSHIIISPGPCTPLEAGISNDVVRYFGERKKIFNIHFRNIRGGLHKFQEVWPDEGDVNMYELAKVLRDVEYPYMLMPDHAPGHPDDTPPPGVSGRVRQAWAFQFGYIIAMIQAVNAAA